MLLIGVGSCPLLFVTHGWGILVTPVAMRSLKSHPMARVLKDVLCLRYISLEKNQYMLDGEGDFWATQHDHCHHLCCPHCSSLPPGLQLQLDAVNLKELTHLLTLRPSGRFLWRLKLKCRLNIRHEATTESLFLKYILAAETRCSLVQLSISHKGTKLQLKNKKQSRVMRAHIDTLRQCTTRVKICNERCRTFYNNI